MLILRFSVGICLAGVLVSYSAVVTAQHYPSRPIRIVTSTVGSGGDFNSRLIAQGISGPLGQPVIVDNRSAGGIIPAEVVAKATPDGYTLLLSGITHWIGPLLRKMPYDPVKDFSPITLVNMAPSVLVVHPSLPVNSVKELIAYAKSKPGELNYSLTAPGGAPHLAAELFKAMTGVNIVGIPYKSNVLEITDLIGGRVQLTFGSGDTVTPHVKSGKLKALAVCSLRPSALFPGLPTVADAGLPGFESAQSSGVFAPTQTPKIIIDRLNLEIVRFLKTDAARERILSSGSEVVASSPEQLATKIQSDIAKLGKVIKDAGINAN